MENSAPALLLRVLLALSPLPGASHSGYLEWLDGVASSAQALAGGDPAQGAHEAERALAARGAGAAGARARLARGLAHRASGGAGEAVHDLDAARAGGGVSPSIAAWIQFERARATRAAGKPAEAAAIFQELATPDAPLTLVYRARAAEADALLAARDPRAAATYERLLAVVPPQPELRPELRLAAAHAWRAAGDTARAAAAYRALWLELPSHHAGREAGRALAAWAREGGPVPPATAGEQLERIERLVLLAHPRRASIALDRLPSAIEPEQKARSSLLRALVLLQLGRSSAEAAVAARCAETRGASPGTLLGAKLVAARVAARAGRVDEAIGRYAALAHESPTSIPGIASTAARELPDDAAYLAAWLQYDARRFAAAAAALHRFATERPSSPHALDARWFEAWSLRRSGRREEARRAFERLESGALGTGALYWRARMEPPHRARLSYERLAAADPGGWYGLLASGRLASLGVRRPAAALATAPPIPDGAGEDPTGQALVRSAALFAVGLRAEGLRVLDAVAAERPRAPAAERAAQLAAFVGDAELPFRLARDRVGLSTRSVRWLHPLAFSTELPLLARRAGIDPLLFTALVRRESGFRVDARSPAGAEGLAQLLPRTAERLNRLLGVTPGLRSRLSEREVSLALGAAYLALLRDRFPEPAAMLVAYNGGPGSAAGWARAHVGRPLDEAVEEIPFRESRRYVKTILAARAVYGALWNGELASIDGARPLRGPATGVAF